MVRVIGATSSAEGPELYGCGAPLAAVARLSARATDGSGGLLFVTGAPGTGRSTLLARAARGFPGAAFTVAAPGHRAPWSGVRALLGALAPSAPAARRALREARGPAGLGAALAGLLSGRGALVCLDDLHAWDAHSRAALAAAWREPAGPGWLVSLAAHHRPPEVPGAESVRLGRLVPDAARALLDAVSPVPVPAVVRERLLHEAAGHPGVVVAAVRRLDAERLSGRAPLPDPVVDDDVLGSVYGGLLASLPVDSRRLLCLAATATRSGGGVAAAETVRAAARAARAPARALDGLVAGGLLGRTGPALRFADPFLERAAVAAAGPGGPALAWGERRRAEPVTPERTLAAGRALLLRGLAAAAGGPVREAHEALLQAGRLLRDEAPAEAADALFLAMEAAWAGGDAAACLAALDGARGAAGPERDFSDGLRAALGGRLAEARPPLARVVARDGAEAEPRLLLRAGSAALVLGDTAAAARIHARALALARAELRGTLVPRALEHLAYAELRAGLYSRAARHAREGLRAAGRTGQSNVAAHQHAVLALAASVLGEDGRRVAEHAGAALATARAHGLVQAATLAEWALARAELGVGLAAQAAARLAPLVRPGPRGGHFALRMLVAPCFVEAAAASGRRAEAREVTEEYAGWAAQGLDRAAPAQLARCRALLAEDERTAYWFGEAVRHHDGCGNDFERARTLLAYGTWLRRRRRPGDARGPLRDALVTFERAAAVGWAERARWELRATGGVEGSGGSGPAALAVLTPQQQLIARLAAQGATNQEIADRLTLSPRTIDHHLRNVYARLQIRSRVQLSGVVAALPRPDGGQE